MTTSFEGSPDAAVQPSAGPVATPVPAGRLDIGWVLSTAFLAATFLTFAVVHLRHFADTGRPAGLAFAVMEFVLVAVFVCRRRPLVASKRPVDWGVAVLGGFGALLFRPADWTLFDLGWLWAGLEATAMVGAAACIGVLGRSFGIVAANRGVRSSGPYRLVRHPIYACYLVAHLAYLAGSFSLANAAVFVAVLVGQILRIRGEERVLALDPTYVDYQQQVRFRMIPGVF